MATRYNYFDPTVDRALFASGVNKMKADGTYDKIVEFHGKYGVHGGTGFFPWHRPYIEWFERELLRCAPELPGLPYWPWDRDQALPGGPKSSELWTGGSVGSDGNPSRGYTVTDGPFADWHAWVRYPDGTYGPRQSTGLVRRLGTYPGGERLPNRQEVEDLFTNPTYRQFDSSPWNGTSVGFRARLEGGLSGPAHHNKGHRFVDGDMRTLLSPNDPVFFLHHCYVDLLWWRWQEIHGFDNYPTAGSVPVGSRLQDTLRGFPGVTVQSVLDYRGRCTYVPWS